MKKNIICKFDFSVCETYPQPTTVQQLKVNALEMKNIKFLYIIFLCNNFIFS